MQAAEENMLNHVTTNAALLLYRIIAFSIMFIDLKNVCLYIIMCLK